MGDGSAKMGDVTFPLPLGLTASASPDAGLVSSVQSREHAGWRNVAPQSLKVSVGWVQACRPSSFQNESGEGKSWLT